MKWTILPTVLCILASGCDHRGVDGSNSDASKLSGPANLSAATRPAARECSMQVTVIPPPTRRDHKWVYKSTAEGANLLGDETIGPFDLDDAVQFALPASGRAFCGYNGRSSSSLVIVYEPPHPGGKGLPDVAGSGGVVTPEQIWLLRHNPKLSPQERLAEQVKFLEMSDDQRRQLSGAWLLDGPAEITHDADLNILVGCVLYGVATRVNITPFRECLVPMMEMQERLAKEYEEESRAGSDTAKWSLEQANSRVRTLRRVISSPNSNQAFVYGRFFGAWDRSTPVPRLELPSLDAATMKYLCSGAAVAPARPPAHPRCTPVPA